MVLMNKKKDLLKKMVRGCKDGMGGPRKTRTDLDPGDYAVLAPYKNKYYKRLIAANAANRMMRQTSLGKGKNYKYSKSKKEALKAMSGKG